MFSELFQLFGSNIKALEILTLLKESKPAARILVKESDKEKIRVFLEQKGLITRTSDFKLLKTDDMPYSDSGIKIEVDDKREGYVVFYVAKKEELCENIKNIEEKNNHYELGIALGYPQCCALFFQKTFGKETDLTLQTLKNSEGFIFDFHNNIALRHFDLSLLFHFPCSFECKESIKHAVKHLDLLQEDDCEKAVITEGMLKGAVLYSSSNVILLRKSRIEDQKIYYDGLMAIQRNEVYQQLKNEESILVHSNTSFQVNTVNFSYGVMYFI